MSKREERIGLLEKNQEKRKKGREFLGVECVRRRRKKKTAREKRKTVERGERGEIRNKQKKGEENRLRNRRG